MTLRPHRRNHAGLIALCAFAALAAQPGYAASLVGSKVSYTSYFPSPGSVLSSLGTQTVADGTTFNDDFEGLHAYFVGDKLVVQNTLPLAFAASAFNGPQFKFSGVGITGASVDAASSPDIKGVLSTTGDSVEANLTGKSPAVGSSLVIDLSSSAPLAGQDVTYTYIFPTDGALDGTLGTKPLVDTTSFLDNNDGIIVAVGPRTITILNLVPLEFAPGAFNGPDLSFSGVKIAGASIDPLSASDFLGALKTTHDSISVNLAGLAPALGHALVIDVNAAPVPEPAAWTIMVMGFGALGLALRRRRARPAAIAA